MHRLFDADSKGSLTEDEVGSLLEVISDVVDRIGLVPLASQDEIDTMLVEVMTNEDGEFRYVAVPRLMCARRCTCAHVCSCLVAGPTLQSE